jgi:hypothetical protein
MAATYEEGIAERERVIVIIREEARQWSRGHRVSAVLARLLATIATGSSPLRPPAPISDSIGAMTSPLVLPHDAPAAALREAACLSLGEVADRLACSRPNVSQTERRGGGISLEALARFAAACDYEIEIVAKRKR